MKNQNTIRGNALFMILIAIVLLGGLTVLLTRTGGQTEETGSTEQLSIQVSELLKYSGGIASGVNNLFLKGCGENQISFNFNFTSAGTQDVSGLYYNSGAPADLSCHVFRPEGAGLKHKDPSVSYWGGASFYAMGTPASELAIFTTIADKNFCMALNTRLGITNSSNDAPTETITVAGNHTVFKGTYDVTSPDPGSNNAAFAGKKAGCMHRTDGDYYQYFQILKVR